MCVSCPTARDGTHAPAMLHIAKLAVGVGTVEQLGALQRARATREPPLRHRTRYGPKRRDELLEGGSLYWVVAGSMLVRQGILDVVEDCFEDGSPAAAFLLHPELVRTDPRPTRAFQGWRYLSGEAAPPDLCSMADPHGLPVRLHAELRNLCLI